MATALAATTGRESSGSDHINDDAPRENFATSIKTTENRQFSLKALLIGQSLSFAAASAGAAQTSMFLSCGVTVPVLSSSFTYFLLSFYWFWLPVYHANGIRNNEDDTANAAPAALARHCNDSQEHNEEHQEEKAEAEPSPTPIQPFRRRRRSLAWWIYFVIALLDVEANYTFLCAFRYTSLTSASLLQSLSVVSAMFCGKLFLQRQFTWKHYVGVVFCVSGGILMVGSDMARQGESGDGTDAENDNGDDDDDDDDADAGRYPYAFWGDLLALSGAALFGMNDNITEFVVKDISRIEFLAMLGIYGTLVSIVQVFLVERSEVMTLLKGINAPVWKVLLQLLWFSASTSYYYMVASWFLSIFDATLLNLSLQSVGVWATFFSVVAQRILPPLAFGGAFVLVVTGVLIYETSTNAMANTAVDAAPTVSRRDHDGYEMVSVKEEVEEPPVPANSAQGQGCNDGNSPRRQIGSNGRI